MRKLSSRVQQEISVTPTEVSDIYCNYSKKPCRFCSNETLLDIRRVGDLESKTFRKQTTTIPLGQYCNNACCWTTDLPACPMDVSVKLADIPPSVLSKDQKKLRKALRIK